MVAGLCIYLFVEKIFGFENACLSITDRIFIWLCIAFLFCFGLLMLKAQKNTGKKKHLIFSLIFVISMVLMIEGGLQLFRQVVIGDDVQDKTYLAPAFKGKEWAKELFEEYDGIPWDYVPYLGWVSREYHGKHININKDGYREGWNPDLLNRDKKTVYVFGGSTVFGTGARDAFTLPSQISRVLNQHHKKFHIINYGEKSYTFTQGLFKLILLLRDGHKPDYVLFYDGINDVHGAYASGQVGMTSVTDNIRKKMKDPLKAVFIKYINQFRHNCMTYRSVQRIVMAIYVSNYLKPFNQNYNDVEKEELSQDIAEYYMKSSALLEEMAETFNFKYVQFWQPVLTLEKDLTKEELALDLRLTDIGLRQVYKNVQKKLASQKRENFFDVSNVLLGTRAKFYVDYAHLSEEGNHKVALEIAEIIKKVFELR